MRREAEDGAAADGVSDSGDGGEERGGGRAHEERPAPCVELRSLFQAAPALMNEVKKLNLGVLPVQCPALCYKRAVNHDHARLSHAAVVRKDDDEDGKERQTKRCKREGEQEEEKQLNDLGGGSVVGAVLAEHDPIHKVVHIQTLAVDARHRRLGVGKMLVQHVVERALALDRIDCVQLHVHVANDDAIAFYMRLGFSEHKRIDNYYRHLEPRTCIVLRRDILTPPST